MPAGVPMWQCPDLRAALARVQLAAEGTARPREGLAGQSGPAEKEWMSSQ